ncbi:MAG: hypothetical protein IPI26_11125 [Elusimicrobia bacterium]|nr:hypothetical protein [Elusimicrobiota bacterium]MBK8652208.1 hypothetical protein [Elusimicrobiota bacterium]
MTDREPFMKKECGGVRIGEGVWINLGENGTPYNLGRVVHEANAAFNKRLDEEIATRETKLLARIAELERVLKSVAAYVEEGECYCFNAEEDLGRNPCDFCVASREIKTVMGRE